MIVKGVDVTFDVIWRGAGGERTIVTFTHHFDPPDDFNAVPFEADAEGTAAPAVRGDTLILRMAASGATPGPSYIPNGDGALTQGRIPSLTLPVASPP